MKSKLTKNWIAKILSLLLAIVIWFLIKQNLPKSAEQLEKQLEKTFPRAIPVREK
mgnify:CR=1 FL=1